MIRTIQTEEITRNIKEMCMEANHFLAEDMEPVSYTHLTLPTTSRV